MSGADRRPAPETLEARAVVRWLEEAETRLASAQKVTTDRAVADACDRIRRQLRDARKRAGVILKDQNLRTAAQLTLDGDGGESC